MNVRIVPLMGAAVLLAAGCQKVEIRRQVAPGVYVSTIDMDMRQTVTPEGAPEQARTQQVAQQMVMRMEAGEPDEQGRQTVRISFASFKQTARAGGRTMTYDSEAPPEDPPGPIARRLAPLLDVTIAVTVDREGQAVDADGLDALWDRLAEANPKAAEVFVEMKKSLGDDAIRQMMNRQQGMNPPRAVGVGDTWSFDTEMGVPVVGLAKLKYDCRVMKISETPEGTIVEVALDGSIRQTPGEEPVEAPGGGRIQSLDVDQKGTLELVAETGLTRKTHLTQHTTFDLSVPAGEGGERRRMSAVQDMDLTVDTVRAEEAPAAAAE